MSQSHHILQIPLVDGDIFPRNYNGEFQLIKIFQNMFWKGKNPILFGEKSVFQLGLLGEKSVQTWWSYYSIWGKSPLTLGDPSKSMFSIHLSWVDWGKHTIRTCNLQLEFIFFKLNFPAVSCSPNSPGRWGYFPQKL